MFCSFFLSTLLDELFHSPSNSLNFGFMIKICFKSLIKFLVFLQVIFQAVILVTMPTSSWAVFATVMKNSSWMWKLPAIVFKANPWQIRSRLSFARPKSLVSRLCLSHKIWALQILLHRRHLVLLWNQRQVLQHQVPLMLMEMRFAVYVTLLTW